MKHLYETNTIPYIFLDDMNMNKIRKQWEKAVETLFWLFRENQERLHNSSEEALLFKQAIQTLKDSSILVAPSKFCMTFHRGKIPLSICKHDTKCIKTHQSAQIQHQKASNTHDTKKQPYAGSYTTLKWLKAGKSKKNQKIENQNFICWHIKTHIKGC